MSKNKSKSLLNNNSDYESAAEQYASILADSSEPNYYSQIPGIINYCTYLVDGVSVKISPIAKTLYTVIKQLAGQKGVCWVGRRLLAELVNCSTGAITNAKRELSQKMEQLNGKPLITISKLKRNIYNESGEIKFATIYDQIKIESIWPENNAFMGVLIHNSSVHKSTHHKNHGHQDCDPQGTRVIECETLSQGAESSVDQIQNQQIQKHSVKEQNQSQRGRTPFVESRSTSPPRSMKTCDCSSPSGKTVKPVRGEANITATHLENDLVKFGCDSKFVKEILKNFNAQTIDDALEYTKQQLKKKAINNKLGYFREALKSSRKWHFDN
jgi:hypothetical protein